MVSLNVLTERLYSKTWMTSLIWICLINFNVFGYYCDHNYCEISSQYCCGDNLCCDYVNQILFNSIILIIAIITIASIFWALFRIFFFNNTLVIIKKFGQKFLLKQNNTVIDKKVIDFNFIFQLILFSYNFISIKSQLIVY